MIVALWGLCEQLSFSFESPTFDEWLSLKEGYGVSLPLLVLSSLYAAPRRLQNNTRLKGIDPA